MKKILFIILLTSATCSKAQTNYKVTVRDAVNAVLEENKSKADPPRKWRHISQDKEIHSIMYDSSGYVKYRRVKIMTEEYDEPVIDSGTHYQDGDEQIKNMVRKFDGKRIKNVLMIDYRE